MKIAVFDNPATCAREIWADGVLCAFITAEAVTRCPEIHKLIRWPMHGGPFIEGRIFGDADAMEKPH